MIRTILFDLGNVLVHFSHERMCEQIGIACGLTTLDVRRFLIESGLMWQFERGKVSEAELLKAVEQETGKPAEREALSVACSDIFTLNETIVPVLASLREQGLRLVLLSNTSSWHIDSVRRQWPVLNHFHQLVLSYEIGAIKPEAEAFEAAVAAIECLPEECFYTDDIPAYVARGREFGLNAEVFTDTEALRGHLREIGISVP